MYAASRRLRESALAVAHFIVFDEMPWSLAREKAADAFAGFDIPPSDLIESAVRETWATFKPEFHRTVLLQKRLTALRALQYLDSFDAFLCGSVLNGCAGSQSSIRIEVFEEDEKAVLLSLIDAGLDVEAIENEPGPMPEPTQSLGFLLRSDPSNNLEAVRIEIFPARYRSRNPRRTKPDAWQEPWEACGRIRAEELTKRIGC